MSLMLGAKALKRLAIDNDVLKYHSAKLNSAIFKGGEVPIFEFVDGHFRNFHVLPALETLETKFPELKDIETPEPSQYYLKKLDARFGYDLINRSTAESREVLKNNPDDLEAVERAFEINADARGRWLLQKHRTKIMDVGLELPSVLIKTYAGILENDNTLPAFFGWPFMDEMGGAAPGDVVSFVGRPAAGKAQPLDAKVLTINGWKLMGDIKVGDELASVDGEVSVVEGVYPQGSKPVYRVAFSDGRSTEASEDHLWEVFYRDWEAPQVLTTSQLIAKLKHARYQKRLSVRLFSGKFGGGHEEMHPYLLGALLGDGCFRNSSVGFSTRDTEIVTRLDNLLRRYGCYLAYRNGYDYQIVATQYTKSHPIINFLKSYGLWDKKSQDKFIPEAYLRASVLDRWELLRGLMDTDGTADKNGGVSFCSSSKTLAEQVQYLVRSLGGKASLREKATAKLDAYLVHIVLPDQSKIFHLSRKRERVEHERTTHTNHRLTITSIDYVGEKECQCISVSHPSKLYVTDDFVVTHNTYFNLYVALHNWEVREENVLFCSPEMGIGPIGQRIGAMYAHVPITQLKMKGFSSQTWDIFEAGMEKMSQQKGKFYVIDANMAASVDEIYALASILKCRIVFIDGAYLLKHPNKRLDRFTRVAENIEWIKQLTEDFKFITFASWQFNRDASKKLKSFGKKNNSGKPDVEDIGYSDAIGQISSIILAIMQEEGIETILSRDIDLIKGRGGEVGKFKVHWDFNTMDFSQYGLTTEDKQREEATELQYV